MKQLQLFKDEQLKFHGGQVNQGQRKGLRPLATRKPIHLVLKCNKSFCLFEELNEIKYYINKYSWKFCIRIYNLSVQHDHIHFLIKIEDRESYIKFNRSLTGILARKYGKGLWQLSPFTRVLNWGAEYETVKQYINQNEDEVWGVKPYKPRSQKYQKYVV